MLLEAADVAWIAGVEHCALALSKACFPLGEPCGAVRSQSYCWEAFAFVRWKRIWR